jgi:hypothetical protein
MQLPLLSHQVWPLALQVDTQDNSLVQSVISCTVDGQNLLVLGNEGGMQVKRQLLLSLPANHNIALTGAAAALALSQPARAASAAPAK